MKFVQSFGNKVNRTAQIVAVGAVTGLFAGVIVTFFNLLFEACEEFSRGYYTFFLENPAYIPLLFAALFLGAIVIGGLLRVLPILRGSGFAQTEGAARGLLRFKWYQVLTGTFAAALFTVFMGLSAGAEGPSVFIGGACGYGTSEVFRRDSLIRRYQITGGACAGLAVALNAPLTGIIFAYEEAHKRFTPEVFVCSFISVVIAVITKHLILAGLGLPAGPFLGTFTMQTGDLRFCLYALGGAAAVSLVAVLFYHLVFWMRKLFRRITFWKEMGKYLIPFLLAGVCGLITVWVMGGGVDLIEALGSGAKESISLFGAPLWAALLVILFLKFVVTVVNTGSDLPCCAALPMFAMGALIGKLMSLLFLQMGMDPVFADSLIVLCMVTFFTAVVKAPITGIIMVVELTQDFTYLLSAILCATAAYFIGTIFHTHPMYDVFLDELLEERRKKAEKITVSLLIGQDSAGRSVADVLWPFTALVTMIDRGGVEIVPKGATVLEEGDLLTVEGAPDDREEYLTALEIIGDIVPQTEESEKG